MDDLQLGRRVVVRYGLEDGDSHQSSDALGVVTEVDAEAVEISTKRGPLRIARERILLVHEVPPAPTRPGPTHEIVSAVDLRRISAAAWLPRDVSWLHEENLRREGAEDEESALLQKGWLLRSSPVSSRRANSALPVTDTGLGDAGALDAVEEWYRRREAVPQVQIYSSADSTELAPECSGLAPLLSERGYVPSAVNLLLTGSTAEAAAGLASPRAAAVEGLDIDITETPGSVHYAAWNGERDPGSHAEFRALIEADAPCEFITAFATHPDGSRTMVATVRVVERSKWGVLTNLVTHPELRRRGAGRSVVRAAAAHLAQRGVRSYLVDVEGRNEASIGLFTSLGAGVRHRYWYARAR